MGLIVLSCLVGDLHAQQVPQYTLTMLDKYRDNPGYGGMDASLSITGAIKTQWETLPGSPKFQSVTAHMPLYIAGGGVGIQFFHDALGVEETTGFEASYNYVYESSIGLFSFGLSLGLMQKSLDGSKLLAPDGIYEGFTIVHNDPILSDTRGSGIAPSTNFGVYFANDYIEAGLSVDQFLANKVTLNNTEETTFELKRTVNAFAEYSYPLNDLVQLYPAVFVKSDLVQTQVDFTIRADYQDVYFGGLLFRGYSAPTIDALAMFVGARLSSKLSVSYAYDITLSSLSKFSEGTHEIVLHYNLSKPIGIGRPERIIYNPRF